MSAESPPRIRGVLSDRWAALGLVCVILWAAVSGYFIARPPLVHAGVDVVLVLVATATGVLLGLLYTTDRRLREVST